MSHPDPELAISSELTTSLLARPDLWLHAFFGVGAFPATDEIIPALWLVHTPLDQDTLDVQVLMEWSNYVSTEAVQTALDEFGKPLGRAVAI